MNKNIFYNRKGRKKNLFYLVYKNKPYPKIRANKPDFNVEDYCKVLVDRPRLFTKFDKKLKKVIKYKGRAVRFLILHPTKGYRKVFGFTHRGIKKVK